VAAARVALRAGNEDGDGIAAATADLLTALAAGRGAEPWGEQWGTAADRFDRAARAPGGHPSDPGRVARELRLLARRLLTTRGRGARGAVGGVALAVALAALVTEIAAWQAARGRNHQAAAARRTATAATELVLEHPPAAPPGRARSTFGGTAGHGARHGRVEGRDDLAAGRTASPPYNSAKVTYRRLALWALVRCSQLDGAVARWAAARAGYVRGGDEQDQPAAEPAADRAADQAAHPPTATLAVAGWRRSLRTAEAVGVMITKGRRSLRLIGYVRRLNRPSRIRVERICATR
jgi:hypothetical protein